MTHKGIQTLSEMIKLPSQTVNLAQKAKFVYYVLAFLETSRNSIVS